MAPRQTEIVILAAAVVYGLLTFPTTYMTATSVGALLVYLATKSVSTVAIVFIGAALLRLFIVPRAINPALPGSEMKDSVYTKQQREGFQAKDPISIHKRIEKNKAPAPLNPKTATITGVLESPEILDSLQISPVLPAEQGGAMHSRHAALKAPEIIPTPPELTPTSTSVEHAPVSNPVLQNGPDNEGIFTALIAKGTALFKGQPSTNVKGASSGPSDP
jgi:hypothetical protein